MAAKARQTPAQVKRHFSLELKRTEGEPRRDLREERGALRHLSSVPSDEAGQWRRGARPRTSDLPWLCFHFFRRELELMIESHHTVRTPRANHGTAIRTAAGA